MESPPLEGTAMTDERDVVMTVECQHCKAKQKVHVAVRAGVGGMGKQTISCIECEKNFDVIVPDKIIRGPFPS